MKIILCCSPSQYASGCRVSVLARCTAQYKIYTIAKNETVSLCVHMQYNSSVLQIIVQHMLMSILILTALHLIVRGLQVQVNFTYARNFYCRPKFRTHWSIACELYARRLVPSMKLKA